MKTPLICLLPFLVLSSCKEPPSAKVELDELTAQDVAWGMNLKIWKFDLPDNAQGEAVDNLPAEPDVRWVTLVLIDAKGKEELIGGNVGGKIEHGKFPIAVAMQRLPSGDLLIKLRACNSEGRCQVSGKVFNGQHWATLGAPNRVGNYFYLAADSQTSGFSGTGFDDRSTKLALKVVRGKAAAEKK